VNVEKLLEANYLDVSLTILCETRKMRLLILCSANSARSQMGEGWAQYFAKLHDLDLEVFSAGTKATTLNPNAIAAMSEVGIDLSKHTSKTLYDLPNPWGFDVVLTVCDNAAENCPVYPAQTLRLHHSFPDPAGQTDEAKAFREVRDLEKPIFEQLILDLKAGRTPTLENA
jgi:arsenate reductase (thioredoxin)